MRKSLRKNLKIAIIGVTTPDTVCTTKPTHVRFRGMQAKHALISVDQSLVKAAEAGEIWLEDESGFRLGLEGALHDGARIYIRRK